MNSIIKFFFFRNVNLRSIYGNFCNYIASCSVQDLANNITELKKKFRNFANTSTNVNFFLKLFYFKFILF